LKDKIIVLAQRHRRYGAGMIYLKLRQTERDRQPQTGGAPVCRGWFASKERKRKKIPLADRHPLQRPMAANQCGRWTLSLTARPKDAASRA
jgi:hypothetical protein